MNNVQITSPHWQQAWTAANHLTRTERLLLAKYLLDTVLTAEEVANEAVEQQHVRAGEDHSDSIEAGRTFLLSLVGLAPHDETDLSEQAEDVLAEEIDPVRGWALSPVK